MSNSIFSNGSDMAKLIHNFDWHATSLGSIENWSTSLITTTAMMLENRFPMALWWGKDLLFIYNDAYIPVLGDKHPNALGQPTAEVWGEIWHILGPQSEMVLNGDGATWNEHLLLPMNRKGFLEETYFTFSYSPVRDNDGEIGGVLVTCQETTAQVQFQRQLQMLRDLGTNAAMTSAEDACITSAAILEKYDIDIPFALLYLVEESGTKANLAATAGLVNYEALGKIQCIDLQKKLETWPLGKIKAAEGIYVLDNLDKIIGYMPRGQWEALPKTAVILPLTGAGKPTPYGYLVAGVSPLRVLDDQYKEMYRLAADQIVIGIANACAYQEERKRAEALAEIDKAKTVFFSNVSHEFRTPLTLILGPLEDLLQEALPEHVTKQIDTIHRNAQRMLKLVNSLLDFSRIEAGRVEAVYSATDLAEYTSDLASTFRSAVEKAGIELVVECDQLPESIYVDCEMWEKVVLNLLSNAFKYTFEGKIILRLIWCVDCVKLVVEDTGIGISKNDQKRLFERFYRVQGARSRTHEGTGIGLALIKELVKMHCGSIEVQSEVDHGSKFTVLIPTGSEHLPKDRINGNRTLSSTSIGAIPYVEESLRWLPDSLAEINDFNPQQASKKIFTEPFSNSKARGRILIVDDNADMREYLYRLLRDKWNVEVRSNGLTALESVLLSPPDLILSDIMMPVMDGIELLHELRANPSTRLIPVILLSARAGEEARIEGLEKGADDYLIKPFSSRELVAKVSAQIEMASIRRQALQRENELLKETKKLDESIIKAKKDEIKTLEKVIEMKDDFLSVISHEFRTPLNVITAAIQAMNLICKDEMSDRAKRYIKMIKQNALRQLRLVNNILDITRANAGRINVNKRNVDIVFLTKAITESVNAYASKKGVQVLFTSTISRKIIGVDDEKYERILLNLISNAIKFSPEGKAVIVKLRTTKTNVYIQVSDKGIGIPKDKMDMIFQRFGQVDSSLSRNAEGAGIGLSLVKKFVEALGGSVAVESKLGNGSTFTVVLPNQRTAEDGIDKPMVELLDNRLVEITNVEFSDIYL
jgi:signal transduction histidine kinase